MAEACEDDALAAARLPTRFGEFRILAFPGETTNREHIALALGNMEGELLVRIHSECLTGDVFHSDRCDCGEQLDLAMSRIAEVGSGVIIYLRQEGRGIGLVNKLHAYNLQDDGLDTVEANEKLGFSGEMRQYGDAVTILKSLGVDKVALLTNNPAKVEALREAGLTVRREPHAITPKAENRDYLRTKSRKMGHLIPPD